MGMGLGWDGRKSLKGVILRVPLCGANKTKTTFGRGVSSTNWNCMICHFNPHSNSRSMLTVSRSSVNLMYNSGSTSSQLIVLFGFRKRAF